MDAVGVNDLPHVVCDRGHSWEAERSTDACSGVRPRQGDSSRLQTPLNSGADPYKQCQCLFSHT